jgi:DNA-binding transcriptional LysR family regulator
VINVKQLQVFRAVMQTTTISSAARQLSVSQPAVTKMLHGLEEAIGRPLFARVKGRIYPTPEARLLFSEVDRLFEDFDLLEVYAREIRKAEVGRLSVATVTTLATSLAAEAVRRFQNSRPKVQAEIKGLASRAVIDQVFFHWAEVGLLDQPWAQSHADLELQPLCETELVCIMPKGHPLEKRDEIAPADLMGSPLISFSDATGIGMKLRRTFRDLGLPDTIAIVTNQTLSACALVRAGAGLALVDPFQLVAKSFPDLVGRRFSPSIGLKPCIVLSKARPQSRIAIDFARHVQEVMASMIERAPHFLRAPGDPLR